MLFRVFAVVQATAFAALCGEPTPRQVWAGPQVNFLGAPSADGRFLSFVDSSTGDLAVRDLDTGQIRRLTANRKGSGEFAYFSVISPDSRQVAYAWFNDRKFYELRLVGLDASGPRLLFRNEESGFVQPCAFSPDGKNILTLFFRKDNISQIALVSIADGSVRVLKSLNWVYPKKMDFSPDGRFIVYDNFAKEGSSTRDIFVLSADGTRETRVVEHPAEDLFPVWSPDGGSIVFASDRSGAMSAWEMPVKEGKPDGIARLLRENLGRFLPMGITRRGEYYYGLRTGVNDIYQVRVNLEKLEMLEAPSPLEVGFRGRNRAAAWSPSGRWIAYLSRRGSENFGQPSWVLVIHETETKRERELKVRLSHIEALRWSPDERWLLASGSDRRSIGGLYRIDVQSGAVQPVVQDEGADFRGLEGVWSGDGNQIYYCRTSVRAREIDSGKERELCPARSARGLSLSRDGAWIAFIEDASVVIADTRSGSRKQLGKLASEGDAHTLWSVDGRRILIATPVALWSISVNSGDTRKLELPAGCQGDISLHPSGEKIAMTLGKTGAEIWMFHVK